MELTNVLNRIIKFDNTSLVIYLRDEELNTFFRECNLELDEPGKVDYICSHLTIKDDDCEYSPSESLLYIFNSSHTIYFLERYLKNNKFFSNLVDLFSNKKFNQKINYINANGIHIIEGLGNNEKKYVSIVRNNILNTQGIEEKKVMISPYLFEEIESLEENKTIYIFLANLFSLFAIAEKTSIHRLNNEDKFTFIIKGEHEQNLTLEVKWPNFNSEEEISTSNKKIENFYECFSWIINSNKDISIDTLMNVVRNYIKRTARFSLDINWELGINSIIDQIIKGETERYFNHVLKLRDEYKYLTDMKFDIRQRIMQYTLTILITITVSFFGKIFTETIISNNDFEIDILLNSDTFFAAIFIFGALIFLLSIFLLNAEYEEIIRYHNQIKEIFVNKFLFNSEEFRSIVGEISNDPLIKKYKNMLLTLTVICFLIGVSFLIGWGNIIDVLSGFIREINKLLNY